MVPADLEWQPTNVEDEDFGSVAAWSSSVPNVRPPVLLDASTPASEWPFEAASCVGVLCVNMTHIAPFSATEGLLAGAGRLLQPGGLLIIYGASRAGSAIRGRSVPNIFVHCG